MSGLTVAEFKAVVDIPGTSDTGGDTGVQRALDSAWDALALAYGRSFDVELGAIKFFRARYSDHLDVTDLIAATEIAIDVDANLTYTKLLGATEYLLEPFNQSSYQTIRIAPLATQSFWPGYMVRVTGDWGRVVSDGADPPVYSALPQVLQAQQLIAQRLLRRKDAPFGIVTAQEMGNPLRIAKTDPDVLFLMDGLDLAGAGVMAFIA